MDLIPNIVLYVPSSDNDMDAAGLPDDVFTSDEIGGGLLDIVAKFPAEPASHAPDPRPRASQAGCGLAGSFVPT